MLKKIFYKIVKKVLTNEISYVIMVSQKREQQNDVNITGG